MRVVAIDFETTGLKWWEPDFRTISMALSWFGKDRQIRRHFVMGEDNIRDQLADIASRGDIVLTAHNAQFEMGVLLCRFPDFPLDLLKYDTMRLAQVYDNGGRSFDAKPIISIDDEIALLEAEAEGDEKKVEGLSLLACVNRLLPAPLHNYKNKYYQWLRDNVGAKRGKEGERLGELPADLLEAYNTDDTDVTLLLFDKITSDFRQSGYDWALDHTLHMGATRRIVEAKRRGISVARPELAEYADRVHAEADNITATFADTFKSEISRIEAQRLAHWLTDPSLTDRGRQARATRTPPDTIKFNPASTSQLTELFIGVLGKEVTFWTKEGKATKAKREKNPEMPPFVPKPSFRAAHLHSYGDGGRLLVDLKKRRLVETQARKLLDVSHDGCWHAHLNSCGTKTGRYTGGDGLNIQGLARRDKGLMGALQARPGHTFVSIDLSAGEPTVTTHFSKDRNYYAACFGMVGKAPYYDDAGVLQIDDIYLMGASVAPTGAAEMRDAFEADWGGKTFAEQWLADPEVIKSKLKKLRSFHKVLMLALQYGQGPKGMVHNAYDNGLVLSLKDAKAFHHAYWNILFPGIKLLGERLKHQFNQQKYLINPFGYRLVPEADRLCLNYFIQSSVSGIMKIIEAKFFAVCPEAKYVSTIHDETILEVPNEYLTKAHDCMDAAVKSLNDDLGWSVNIRTGWKTGATLFEAK